jgi:hypothetical protein
VLRSGAMSKKESGFEWFSGFSGLKDASRQCIAMIGLVRANNRDMNW